MSFSRHCLGPVVLSLRFVSTQTKKALIHLISSLSATIERTRERDLRLFINDEEKREEKKKKRRKERRRERSAARSNVPKTRSSRLSSTTPRWRECRRTNRTARPFRCFSSGESFYKSQDNSKIKKTQLQHARQKLKQKQKKISLLFFKESDRHRKHTFAKKQDTKKTNLYVI